MSTEEQAAERPPESVGKPPSFPFWRGDPSGFPDPYGQIADARPTQVTFMGHPAWLLTRYDDVRALLNHQSASVRGLADSTRGQDTTEAGEERPVPGFFVAMDPPEHDELRGTLVREFTHQRMESLRPAVERIADDLLSAMLAGDRPVDLVQALALPLPSLVICELLGVPYAHHDFFQERTHKVLASDSTPADIVAAMQDVIVYLAQLTAAKEAAPEDDLLSSMTKHVSSGEVTTEDVAGMGALLLMAGHETTGNVIALGTLMLLQHPAQLERLRADPDLIPAAVEELLRFVDVIAYLPRKMTAAVEIGGQRIATGEVAVASTHAANRDPEVFSCPHSFDVGREPARNLAFGYGIHTCIGAPLARLELQVALARLIARIPTLHLAQKPEEVVFKNDSKIYGCRELLVGW